jgi:hypothetical protein
MNALFALIAVALVAIAVWLLGRRRDQVAVLLAVVALAVAYDDAIIAAGATIGAGDLLFVLNVGRYALHVLLTPILVVVAALLLQGGGVGFFGERTAWFVYAALVVLGIVTTFVGFDLVFQNADGVVRYVEPDPVPPLPAILTVFVLIAAGIRWARAGGSKALLISAIVMTVVSAMPQPTPPWPSNLGELVLLAGMAIAAVRPISESSSLVPQPSRSPA